MSKPLLAIAVRDQIRSGLGYETSECECMPSGEPQPRCGNVFVAVHLGGWASNDRHALDRDCDIQVTVSYRLVGPKDMSGLYLIKRSTQNALEVACDEIARFVHMNYAIMNAANTLLGDAVFPRLPYASPPFAGEAAYLQGIPGYCEPLGFQGDSGAPQEQDVGWFGSASTSERPGMTAPAGYSQTLRFGGARMIQAIHKIR